MRFHPVFSGVITSLFIIFSTFSQERFASSRISPPESKQTAQLSALLQERLTGTQFLAPKQGQLPITNVPEIIEAFLKGEHWQEVLPLIYKGDSFIKELKEAYSSKREDFGEYKARLFQMELDPSYGGPFWVYQVFRESRGSEIKGLPLVVRTDGEHLKIDWHTFAEFSEREFVKFIDGQKKGPSEFRLVVERLEPYNGPDREGFSDLDRYECYKLFPPYGDYEEFSEYAFVERGSKVASKLATKFSGNSELPLAMVVELNINSFNHGIRHSLITDVVAEGWLVEPVDKAKKE